MKTSFLSILLLIAFFSSEKSKKKAKKIKKPPPPEDLVIQTLDQGEECEVPTQEGSLIRV